MTRDEEAVMADRKYSMTKEKNISAYNSTSAPYANLQKSKENLNIKKQPNINKQAHICIYSGQVFFVHVCKSYPLWWGLRCLYRILSHFDNVHVYWCT